MKRFSILAVAFMLSVSPSVVPADDGSGDVIDVIDAWDEEITDPEQLKYKYCRMSKSPFAFLRGTNFLYWRKFHKDSRLDQFGSDKTLIWLQGDLHAENFGAFDNDDGVVVYNVNDFDDSVIANYQLDVWRMAISLVLVARKNETLSKNPLEITDDELAGVIDVFCAAYLETLDSYRGNDKETEFIYSIDTTDGKLRKFLKKTKGKENVNRRKEMLDKWSVIKNDNRKFKDDYEKLKAIDDGDPLRDQIKNAMPGYRATITSGLSDEEDYFTVKDVARRIRAGTGSVGADRYYVLIQGKSEESDNDDRILDVKEQSGPTALQFMDSEFRSRYEDRFENHAQRHAIACRALTVHTDDHLGWLRMGDKVFSVRERSPYKETYDTTKLNKVDELHEFAGYWGAVLATAHARADNDDKQFDKDDSDDDKELISYSFEKQVCEATDDKHKEFKQLVREVAMDYAKQVQADFDRFVAERKPAGCEELEN